MVVKQNDCSRLLFLRNHFDIGGVYRLMTIRSKGALYVSKE